MQQRKTPFRPDAEICQAYNDGFVDVFASEDVSAPGYQPVVRAVYLHRLYYAERRLGINRLYLSRQNHAEIQRVLRIPRSPITSFQLVRDERGQWFQVDSIQNVENVFPASLDLALVAVTADVEVQNEPID